MSWDEWADPVALRVRGLRECMRRFAEERNPGKQRADILLAGARKYRRDVEEARGAQWTPDVVAIALADGARIGGGWIVREIPGETGVLTIVRCQLR